MDLRTCENGNCLASMANYSTFTRDTPLFRFVVLASGAISHAVAPQLLKRDRRWALGGIDFVRLALKDAITHR